jgi:hypothetical protein
MPADVLWFKMPPPLDPRLYLIGRLVDENGKEFDRPYNFLSFGTNAVLIFPHSLPGRERLTTLHLSESDFPNNDVDTAFEGSVPLSYFSTPISAPERDVASVPAVELGLKH